MNDSDRGTRIDAGALVFRPVATSDDVALASIIRAGMSEFGICGEGPASDPEVDSISEAYSGPGTAYFIVEANGRVLGGGGIGPIDDAPDSVCELRKMYLLPESRGRGAGRRLLGLCLDAARKRGYSRCHLATLGRMVRARRLYDRAGFQKLDHEVPGSGHLGCDTWYSLEL